MMTDKTAIITGGSRGLGRNTAVHLALRGVDILFTYRASEKEAESLIREVEAMGQKAASFALDTGDVRAFDGFVADIHKTLQAWGRDRFDYLVNNAGNSQHINIDKVTEADFDAVVNVHSGSPSPTAGVICDTYALFTLRGPVAVAVRKRDVACCVDHISFDY